MYISKEMKSALTLFDLELPFLETDLKHKLRDLSMKNHPDKNGMTRESHIRFREIISAYELLKRVASSKIMDDIPETLIRRWEEEEKDLGNIYDPCPACSGTGHEMHKISVLKDCPTCKGKGTVELKCRYCDNGVYTARNGRKTVCRACKNGVWKVVPCRTCNQFRKGFNNYIFRLLNDNIGSIYIDKYVERLCSNCHGRGKIKLDLFNPVIKPMAILKGGK